MDSRASLTPVRPDECLADIPEGRVRPAFFPLTTTLFDHPTAAYMSLALRNLALLGAGQFLLAARSVAAQVRPQPPSERPSPSWNARLLLLPGPAGNEPLLT